MQKKKIKRVYKEGDPWFVSCTSPWVRVRERDGGRERERERDHERLCVGVWV